MKRLEFTEDDFKLPNGEWLNPKFIHNHVNNLFLDWIERHFSGRRLWVKRDEIKKYGEATATVVEPEIGQTLPEGSEYVEFWELR